MVGIVLLGVFVLLLALGAPIAVCLGMSSVSAILVQGAGKPLEAIMSVLPRLCSSASSKFVLLAIPFFILSGNVMEKAGISGRLINLAEKCLGHIPAAWRWSAWSSPASSLLFPVRVRQRSRLWASS